MNFPHLRHRLKTHSSLLLCGTLLFAEGDPKAMVQNLVSEFSDLDRGVLSSRESIGTVRQAGAPTLRYLVQEVSKAEDVQVRLRLLTVMHTVIVEAAVASGTKKIKLPDDSFQILADLVSNKDEHFVTRYWVTKVFAHLSNQKMVEILSTVLEEDEVKESLQTLAIMAIGTERSGDDILVKYSQSQSPRLREAVCDALKEAKTKQVLAVQFQGLFDPSVLVRQAAIQALVVHTGDPKGYDPHAQPESSESWSPISRWYEWVRGEKLDWKPTDQVQFFNCPVPEVRQQVCKTLAGSDAPEVLFTLFTALLDEAEPVREAAMGMLEGRASAPPKHDIHAAAEKRRPSEIAWAKYVQKEVKQWDWVPQARRSFSGVKIALCEALGGIKQKRVVRFLYYMVLDGDADVRAAAISGLNQYRPADSGFLFNPMGTVEERNDGIVPIFKWLEENQKNFSEP